MRTIYKYKINIVGETFLPLPFGHKILSFQRQDDDLFIWVEVDTNNLNNCALIGFSIVGTGHAIPGDAYVYFGTVVMRSMLVWHLYKYVG